MIFRLSSFCVMFCVIAVCAITVASVSAQDQSLAAIQHKAEAGDAKAQYELAVAYFQGNFKGVVSEKDPGKGLEWLKKSAFRQNVGAEYALGYMYLMGEQKVGKDPREAANWFRKAARQQNKAAQEELAAMLTQGLISAEEANWRAAEPPASQTASQTLPHTVPSPPKNVKDKAAPFSLAEVETGVTGGITSKRMATLVQKFGVDFKLSAGTRKRLADEGADDNLLATISASRRSL